MKELVQNGITIKTDLEDITEEEVVKYYDTVIKHNGGTTKDIKVITVKDNGDGTVDLSYDRLSSIKFERIARITGYLSDVSNWNDGKRAEFKERVKHT